MKGDTR